MIAIIDYDAGNIRSVEKALIALGEQPVVTRDKDTILAADKLILPGVGAFGDAMERLHQYGLVDVIREAVKNGTPLLGICLGLQLLFERSDESDGVKGLGILKGQILKIPDSPCLKIPHMGWNALEKRGDHPLLREVSDGAHVYFVHSYYAADEDTHGVAEDTIASTDYGIQVTAAVARGNVMGCQFHPEKSGEIGRAHV